MSSSSSSSSSSFSSSFLRQAYVELARPQYDIFYMGLLLVGEMILAAWIIAKVPYTEIDWIAYMQEVDRWWLDGEYDYRNIYGQTGPLVYPAGFLYLFRFLQWWTDRDVHRAQIAFGIFYVVTQAIVLMLYTKVLRRDDVVVVVVEVVPKISPSSSTKHNNVDNDNNKPSLDHSHKVWSFRLAMGCLCLSKRYHSIFLLRLFNDGPTMFMAYASFWCFVHRRWNVGCFLFSVATSLKMNVLLFAPGLLYLLIETSPIMTIPRLAICGVTQLVLGAPFLIRHPVSYLRKAFELDRQFFFQWTVNFKFLSEDVFLSKQWAAFLLLLHVGLLLLYHYRLYNSTYNNKGNNNNNNKNDDDDDDDDDAKPQPISSPQHILLTLFISNFIGICCARTLHYQFYSWYFSSLPLLLWRGGGGATSSSSSSYYSYVMVVLVRLVLLGMVENAFLTFPATPTSSMCLQLAHWLILIPCILYAGTDDSHLRPTGAANQKEKGS